MSSSSGCFSCPVLLEPLKHTINAQGNPVFETNSQPLASQSGTETPMISIVYSDSPAFKTFQLVIYLNLSEFSISTCLSTSDPNGLMK